MEPIKVDDVVGRLTHVGLPEDEARVYAFLHVLGPVRAGDMAAAIGQSRPKTYRLLEALVSRGYASSSIERPARFEAAPSATLFADLRRAVQSRLKDIDEAEKEVTARLATLRGQREPASLRSKFSIIRGREEIVRMIQRLLDESGRAVDILFHHPAAATLMIHFGTLERIVEKARGGVRSRVALPIDDSIRGHFEKVAKTPNLEIRRSKLEKTVALNLFDAKELVLVMNADLSASPRAEDSVALWSDAREFVGAQQMLFDSAWRDAEQV